MTKTLSICIPTYNRIRYLKEILAMIAPQLQSLQDGQCEFLVINNASTDGTGEFLADYATTHPILRYINNRENIGGDRNFLKCIRESKGEYIWLVGDDDIVNPNAVQTIINLLTKYHPGLLIAAEHAKNNVTVYNDYRECVLKEQAPSGEFVIDHTLISANIFRRDLFDLDFAETKLHLSYAHMFGLMKKLGNETVVVAPALISERPVRAEFAKYPSFLCVKHAIYLCFLAKVFNIPKLRFHAIRKAMNLPMEFGSRIKFHLKKMFLHAPKD